VFGLSWIGQRWVQRLLTDLIDLSLGSSILPAENTLLRRSRSLLWLTPVPIATCCFTGTSVFRGSTTGTLKNLALLSIWNRGVAPNCSRGHKPIYQWAVLNPEICPVARSGLPVPCWGAYLASGQILSDATTSRNGFLPVFWRYSSTSVGPVADNGVEHPQSYCRDRANGFFKAAVAFWSTTQPRTSPRLSLCVDLVFSCTSCSPLQADREKSTHWVLHSFLSPITWSVSVLHAIGKCPVNLGFISSRWKQQLINQYQGILTKDRWPSMVLNQESRLLFATPDSDARCVYCLCIAKAGRLLPPRGYNVCLRSCLNLGTKILWNSWAHLVETTGAAASTRCWIW